MKDFLQKLEFTFKEFFRNDNEFKKTIEKDIQEIYVDENQFLIALKNIIMNSIEVMNYKGYITLDIYRESHPLDSRLSNIVFQIADSGPGTPPEIQKDLFKPFFTTKNGGSGIGLYLTKKIIEFHQGEIIFRPNFHWEQL